MWHRSVCWLALIGAARTARVVWSSRLLESGPEENFEKSWSEFKEDATSSTRSAARTTSGAEVSAKGAVNEQPPRVTPQDDKTAADPPPTSDGDHKSGEK